MTSIEFSKIVEDTKGIVLSAIRKNLAERFYSSIDDVVQEVYFRAYKSLVNGKFRKESELSTWLYTIAKNESLRMNEKLIREEKKSEKLKSKQISDSKTNSLDSGSEISLLQVRNFIKKLPQIYREVLMKFIEGKPEKVIAEELNLNQGTVKSRTSRGKEILRKEFLKGGESEI